MTNGLWLASALAPNAVAMLFNRAISALTLSAAISACASVPPARSASWTRGDRTYAEAYLRWMIEGEMRRADVRGLSVAVVNEQRILWHAGFGFADAERRVAASPETVYYAGSVSKVVTAALAMRLVDAQRIELDAPVTRYLPALTVRSRFASAPITMRQLLSHCSGLPTNVLHGMWADEPAPLSSIPALLADESLASEPAAMYRYSNVGFALAGHVIETVDGRAFETAARELLFAPLSMPSTSFAREPALLARLSQGYGPAGVQAPRPLRDAPAGSLLTTVDDLGRFAQMLLRRGRASDDTIVLRDASVDELFAPQFDGRRLSFSQRVGMDWRLGGVSVRGADEPVAWHNGLYPPFNAHVGLLRNAKLAVVVLANTESARSFIVRVGARALELMLEADTGAIQPASAPTPVTPVALAATELDPLAGEFVGSGGQRVSVRREGAALHARFAGGDMALVPISPTRFVLPIDAQGQPAAPSSDSLSATFERAGDDLALHVRGADGLSMLFQRSALASVPEAWRARAGRYTTDSTGDGYDFTHIELRADGTQLALYVERREHGATQSAAGSIVLRAASDDEAIALGLDDDTGQTLRAGRDSNGEFLRFSGFTLRRAPAP